MRRGYHGPSTVSLSALSLTAPTLRLRTCYRIDISLNSWGELLQSRVIHHCVTLLIYGQIRGQRRPQKWGNSYGRNSRILDKSWGARAPINAARRGHHRCRLGIEHHPGIRNHQEDSNYWNELEPHRGDRHDGRH